MSQLLLVDPATDEKLAQMEKKSGPNNFFRALANRPEAMDAFAKLYGTLMGPSSLDRRIKEMVYLAVSFVNECDYCGTHHRNSAPKAGLSDTEIHEIQTENNSNFIPREQAALQYARELTRTCDVDDNLRYRVRELFPTDQFVELTMIVALANFTNRVSNGLPVPLEH